MLIISGYIPSCNAENLFQYTQTTKTGILHFSLVWSPSPLPPLGSWGDYSWGSGDRWYQGSHFISVGPKTYHDTHGIPNTYLNRHSFVTKNGWKTLDFHEYLVTWECLWWPVEYPHGFIVVGSTIGNIMTLHGTNGWPSMGKFTQDVDFTKNMVLFAIFCPFLVANECPLLPMGKLYMSLG